MQKTRVARKASRITYDATRLIQYFIHNHKNLCYIYCKSKNPCRKLSMVTYVCQSKTGADRPGRTVQFMILRSWWNIDLEIKVDIFWGITTETELWSLYIHTLMHALTGIQTYRNTYLQSQTYKDKNVKEANEREKDISNQGLHIGNKICFWNTNVEIWHYVYHL